MSATNKKVRSDDEEVASPKSTNQPRKKVSTAQARSKYKNNQPGLVRNFRNLCRCGGLAGEPDKVAEIMDSAKYKLASRPELLRIMEKEKRRLAARKEKRIKNMADPDKTAKRKHARGMHLLAVQATLKNELFERDSLVKQINDLLARDISVDCLNERLASLRDPDEIRADIAKIGAKITKLVPSTG